MEKQIREAILANLFPELKRGQIKNIVKEYNQNFKPREREFLILQKKITELEEKTTKAWKVIYGLAVPKLGQEDPFMDMEGEYEEGKKEKEVRVKEIEKKIEEKVDEAPKAEQQLAEQVQEQSSPHSIPTE